MSHNQTRQQYAPETTKAAPSSIRHALSPRNDQIGQNQQTQAQAQAQAQAPKGGVFRVSSAKAAPVRAYSGQNAQGGATQTAAQGYRSPAHGQTAATRIPTQTAEGTSPQYYPPSGARKGSYRQYGTAEAGQYEAAPQARAPAPAAERTDYRSYGATRDGYQAHRPSSYHGADLHNQSSTYERPSAYPGVRDSYPYQTEDKQSWYGGATEEASRDPYYGRYSRGGYGASPSYHNYGGYGGHHAAADYSRRNDAMYGAQDYQNSMRGSSGYFRLPNSRNQQSNQGHEQYYPPAGAMYSPGRRRGQPTPMDSPTRGNSNLDNLGRVRDTGEKSGFFGKFAVC
eukprot:TRINITY_DN14387_c0_g1_i1.p1 TRINITY_DN14387_c0_g1~~TRINITY_DN14387_c0_g1_i1.p1  ORF type:complete len:340 (+),score=72.73 TRINITY_DN14387_c0_g1_i1:138-1157(+)